MPPPWLGRIFFKSKPKAQLVYSITYFILNRLLQVRCGLVIIKLLLHQLISQDFFIHFTTRKRGWNLEYS